MLVLIAAGMKAEDGMVERYRSHLEQNGKRLYESDMAAMADSHVFETWKEADDLFLTGRVIRYAGWGALATGFGMWVTAVLGLDTDLGWAAVYVASTSVVFVPLGYIIQGVGRKKLDKVADMCNIRQGMKAECESTITLAPSLITGVANNSMHGSSAVPGASVVITF